MNELTGFFHLVFSAIANLLMLSVFLVWLHRRLNSRKSAAPVTFAYFFSLIALCILSMMLHNEYLDFLGYGLIGTGALSVFWIWSSLLIIVTFWRAGEPSRIFAELMPGLFVIVFPFLGLLWLSTQSLKIGG